MKAENIGNTAVITAEYLKNRNGEKRVKDLQIKHCKADFEEQGYRNRRSERRKG
jgi:hypothetical protein